MADPKRELKKKQNKDKIKEIKELIKIELKEPYISINRLVKISKKRGTNLCHRTISKYLPIVMEGK